MNGNSVKIEEIKKSSRVALNVTNIVKTISAVCGGMIIVAGCIMIGLRGVINHGFITVSYTHLTLPTIRLV